MNARKPVVLAFVAVLWLALVAGFYYVVHKPVMPAAAGMLALSGWRLVVAGGVVSLAGGIGVWGHAWPQAHPLVRLVSQAALGMGALGALLLVMGLTFGYSPLKLGVLMLLLAAILRKQVCAWWQAWGGIFALWEAGGRLGRGIGWGVGCVLVFTLLTALGPPLKFDALVYHLALPQAYLDQGRFVYLPWNIFWGMPQTGEMLYLAALAFGGEGAAALTGWITGFLTLAGLAGYLAERVGPQAGWVGAAALLSGFTLAASLAWGYVDWQAMLFGLATLIFLDEWRRAGTRRFLWLSALSAGFAIGTKYSAGVVALGGALVVLWQNRRAAWRSAPADLGVFVGGALAAAAPWLLKNWAATGNPVYPLFFPSGAMSATRLHFYQNPAPGWDWVEALLLPWQATMTGVEGSGGYAATIGPLLLALGVFAGVGWRGQSAGRQTTLQTAALLSAAGLVFWAVAARGFAYAQQSRLYFAIFPALAVLAGAGFEQLSRLQLPGVRLRRVVGVFILLVLSLNVWQLAQHTVQQGAPQFLLGLLSKDDYLARNLGMTALAMRAVNDLPPEARVLMLWEPRSLNCLPRCIPDEILDRWLEARARRASPAQLLASWRAAGYTHLLFYRFGAEYLRHDPRYTAEDWRTLEDLLARLPIQTDLNQVYTLYLIPP